MAGCVPPHLDAPAASRVAPPAAWRAATNPVAPIEARWWRSFRDPTLSALVEQALVRNTDVLTAVARIDEARAQTALARASISRERASTEPAGVVPRARQRGSRAGRRTAQFGPSLWRGDDSS